MRIEPNLGDHQTYTTTTKHFRSKSRIVEGWCTNCQNSITYTTSRIAMAIFIMVFARVVHGLRGSRSGATPRSLLPRLPACKKKQKALIKSSCLSRSGKTVLTCRDLDRVHTEMCPSAQVALTRRVAHPLSHGASSLQAYFHEGGHAAVVRSFRRAIFEASKTCN